MVLQLTNQLASTEPSTTFNDIECGTVFECEGRFCIKTNSCHALVFIETPIDSPVRSFWDEKFCLGDEKVTIIESELILKSRKG